MTGEWRDIPGRPGYEVSSLGDVRSWRSSSCRRSENPRLLKQQLDKGGYRRVSFIRGALPHCALVHRLVLEAFIGPCPPGMEACHRNGVRSDNRLENLRWDTGRSNNADKRAHGTLLFGDRHASTKYSDSVALKVAGAVGTDAVVSASLGVPLPFVKSVRSGKSRVHLGIARKNRLPRGESHPDAVLTESSVMLLRYLRQAHGVAFVDLASWFEVSYHAAYRAANGESWSHVPAVSP